MLRSPRLVGATIVARRDPVRAAHPRIHDPHGIAARDHHECRRAGRHVGADRDRGSVSRLAAGPARASARVRGDARGCRARGDRRDGRDPTAQLDAGRRGATSGCIVPAGVTTVGLILQSHPEQRYVLFPVILAIIAGAGAVRAGVAWLRAGRPSPAGKTAIDAAIIGGTPHRRDRRGIGRGAARRRDRARKRRIRDGCPPSAELIDGDADGPMRRRDLGAADRRVVLALRGRASSAPPAPTPSQLEPSTTRPTSCSRTSTSAGRRPRPSSAIESCVVPRAVPLDGAPAEVEVYRLTP